MQFHDKMPFLLGAEMYSMDPYERLPEYQIDRAPGSAVYHWYCRRNPSIEGYAYKRRRAKLMGMINCGM